MRKRILKNTALLVVLSIILTFLVMEFVMYNRMYDQMRLRVEDECEYLQTSINDMGPEYLDEHVSRISTSRITLIDTDGSVLFESEEPADELGNHSKRPEVLEAMKDGVGHDGRLSQTLSKQTYYYALRLDNGW
ncbi:hypothetical protein DXA96_15645 [Lachnospiraceae bacterium OF09-33XD]|nr:hypothetical protein DXA96_15645 [Lachnospiraceae bacterium OF09-33XD]